MNLKQLIKEEVRRTLRKLNEQEDPMQYIQNGVWTGPDRFDGDIIFAAGQSPIKSLGNLKRINGDFYVESSKINDLGNLQVVTGDMKVAGCPLKTLGKLKKVGGHLNISYCKSLDGLPDGLKIGKSLNIEKSRWETQWNSDWNAVVETYNQLVAKGGSFNNLVCSLIRGVTPDQIKKLAVAQKKGTTEFNKLLDNIIDGNNAAFEKAFKDMGYASLKGGIRESLTLEKGFSFNDLENYVRANKKQILNNIKTNGYKVNRLPIGNYYDMANILGVDSRVLQGVELEGYMEDIIIDVLR